MAKGARRKDPRIDVLVTASTDRRVALANANFVYKSIAVGLQDADWADNYIPLKFGIPQNTGDTLGPGGLFRGLRCAPVGAGVARDMAELCPKAPLLNYTNPQGSIVYAARKVAPSVQYIGLCHELFGGMHTLNKWAKTKGITPKATQQPNRHTEDWEEFDVRYGGINHFGWLTRFEYQGRDLYPELKQEAMDLCLKNFDGRGFNFYLLDKHGLFPYPGSRHVAEFMVPYYNYFNHEVQAPHWKFPVERNVSALRKARKAAYVAYRLQGRSLMPRVRPSVKGERAMEMTLDWRTDSPTHHVVNIPNRGIVQGLPDDTIVEVPGQFRGGTIQPADTIHLSREVLDLVRPHAEQIPLTGEAAVGNRLELVIKAALHDPMCRFVEDDDRIEYMTKYMLWYQQQWLPAEWAAWIPTEAELRESKWWVEPKEFMAPNQYVKKFPVDESLRVKAFFWTD
jgi:alpha-galactosidase